MSDGKITPPHPSRPLSQKQERKLVEYLEDHFLDLTGNFKKRLVDLGSPLSWHQSYSDPSTTLPSLSSYLKAAHTLLSLILQIPPIDPSTSLRTALLLRLSGDVMDSIPGYKPDTETLAELLAWLNDLDNAWLAVLRAQVWDVDAREGVDLILSDLDIDQAQTLHSAPPTQTERTRLRSLLIGGTAKMEEWLCGLDTTGQDADYETVLENLGLQQGFDDLFSGTLTEMGSLGAAVNGPEGMEGTC
ncbi:hypothetical protein EIP91_001409 [Steccherinum ochraceum]|uniref:Uncharacterized protein n=1 Tax=Steccherinum ochraceum TaxID=92696 RepID=A0A4R0RRF6_9APHY|nr:hypothetical protein EIP91_001409 [Steccherinum ochraceum]